MQPGRAATQLDDWSTDNFGQLEGLPSAAVINRKPSLTAVTGRHLLLLGACRALISPFDEAGQILAAYSLGIAPALVDPLMHVGHQLAREGGQS